MRGAKIAKQQNEANYKKNANTVTEELWQNEEVILELERLRKQDKQNKSEKNELKSRIESLLEENKSMREIFVNTSNNFKKEAMDYETRIKEYSSNMKQASKEIAQCNKRIEKFRATDAQRKNVLLPSQQFISVKKESSRGVEKQRVLSRLQSKLQEARTICQKMEHST